MSICADPVFERSVTPGLYRHYKGGMYRVLAVATHSETTEPVVVYEALAGGDLWARPLSMFCEVVFSHGRSQPRFEFAGDLYGPISYGAEALRARCA